MSRPLALRLVDLALAALLVSALAPAQVRATPARDARRAWNPPAPTARPEGGAGTIAVTDLASGLTPLDLVRFLVGPEVFVANVAFTGNDVAAGIFMQGTGIVGFEEGVVLSTGRVDYLPSRSNDSPSYSSARGAPGDPDLEDLIPGAGLTHDAASLEFDFQCPDSDGVTFQFTFGSEEYSEYVGSGFNDLFALFLNGQHVPAIPGTTRPVSINSINCGNPNDAAVERSNCSLFIDNSCEAAGQPYPCTSAVPIQLDGLTVVLSATASLQPGLNHVKLVIADMTDNLIDSAVFVRSEGFSCNAGGVPVFEPPTPCAQTLQASVGVPVELDVVALATNGQPGASVSLSVAGSPAVLADAVFDPPLPTAPAQPAATHVTWLPDTADAGDHELVFTATDQIGNATTCTVTISVAECWLVLGHSTTSQPLPLGGPEDLLLVEPAFVWPVTLTSIPELAVPDAPAMMLARFHLQVWMYNPTFDPLDPVKVSNALEVQVGGPVFSHGVPDGMHLWIEGSAAPGGVVRPRFSIDGM